eukprot:scaffold67628_cov73-Phaeocystis_antarctica.AAC.8
MQSTGTNGRASPAAAVWRCGATAPYGAWSPILPQSWAPGVGRKVELGQVGRQERARKVVFVVADNAVILSATTINSSPASQRIKRQRRRSGNAIQNETCVSA